MFLVSSGYKRHQFWRGRAVRFGYISRGSHVCAYVPNRARFLSSTPRALIKTDSTSAQVLALGHGASDRVSTRGVQQRRRDRRVWCRSSEHEGQRVRLAERTCQLGHSHEVSECVRVGRLVMPYRPRSSDALTQSPGSAMRHCHRNIIEVMGRSLRNTTCHATRFLLLSRPETRPSRFKGEARPLDPPCTLR